MKQNESIPDQLRAQVVSLRNAGLMVNDICEQLALYKASERHRVQVICESLPRRFKPSLKVGGPIYRKSGRYTSR